MTYGDAITYIVNGGFTFKAIRDLGECAQVLIEETQKNADELRAEKRTVRRFLESDLVTDQKLTAISTLLEEEENDAD